MKILLIVKLLRIEHYIKNSLCFLPLIFHGKLFDLERFETTLIGALAFCSLSSCVYIFNDLQDVERDRLHPRKCHRPLASGQLSQRTAWLLLCAGGVLTCILGYWAGGGNGVAWALLAAYALANVLYSNYLKHLVLVDVGVLASGFLFRLFYGAVLDSITISPWMFLTILSASLFMGLGKRRNEMLCENKENVRSVLKGYTWNFLDRNMYLTMGLTIVFYALWTINSTSIGQGNLKITPVMWTVPGVIFILMRYSLMIERGCEGDPIRVILTDRILQVGALLVGGSLIILRNFCV